MMNQNVPANSGGDDTAERYRAPALEKGLDILELLAGESEPLTVTAIVQRLGRSTGELFRMIQVLEKRGFVEQSSESDGYRLSGKLFALGMEQPTVRTLMEIALPHMRQLSLEIGQSCHLALHSEGQIVVVARMESSELIGLSVRIGYRKPLLSTVSGALLYAYQSEATRRRWEDYLSPRLSKEQLNALHLESANIRKKAYARRASHYVTGVTDISAPILRNGIAAAALTVPFLKTKSPTKSLQDSLDCLEKAARTISNGLLASDQRP